MNILSVLINFWTGDQRTSSTKSSIPLTLQMRAATATALGAAAARAKLLADQEDREIENLVATIIEMQVRKRKSTLLGKFPVLGICAILKLP